MASELVLLVDDEANIIQLARMYFEREGFRVSEAGDGPDGLKAIGDQHPDLVVLDVMLPGMDGFEVCKRVRAANNEVPILMLTARDDDIDKILGLELGADDYLTKPFNPRELVARAKAILRRSNQQNTSQTDQAIKLGDLVIDPARREVLCNGKLVPLRTQEFEVLYVLAQHKGLVLSRDQLLSRAWGFDFAGQTRTVDVHIAQLRSKLLDCQVRIETVTGIGYKLVV
ncbi:MAG TPA: response regulator transcription factor [Longilinea sp.]|nr:response regulator transcription factor [Longilinea sp.]